MSNARDKANIPALNFSSTGIDDNATSTAITIDSNQRVGFGTASPSGITEFKTTADTNVFITAGNANSSQLVLGDTDDIDVGKIRYRHTNNAMEFTVNASERMRIDSSGNVGIGETAPQGKLHIKGSDSGVTSSPSHADELVIENSTNGGITFNCGASNSATITFQNSTYSDDGALSYRNSDRAMTFKTASSERMRIDSNGFTKHSNTGVYDTYVMADDAHQFVSDNQTHSTLWVTNTNASYSNVVQKNETARTPNSAFSLLTTTTGNLTDDQHRLRGDGNAYCDGSWNGGGADYAEYFEWSDGNINNEDRVGYSVVLDGNKIRKATNEDNPNNIIGVVSGNPFVVGDDAWSKWHEKYLKDDFGRYILEEYTITEWEKEITQNEEVKKIKVSFETDKIPSDEVVPENATVLTKEVNGEVLKRRILNPNFDETSEYITREDRKEWDTVGLLGKVRIRIGQPVGDRWIKMRDISDTVEEWLIK